MPEAQPTISRRKWKRFRISGSAIVLLHKPSLLGFGKPTFIELGPIIDISLGGLAAQYVDSKKRQIECFELAISLPDKGVVLERIPFEIILDREVATLPDARKVRNRCVKFGELNSYQSLKLEAFIKKHTTYIITERRSGTDRRQFEDARFHDDVFKALHERRVLGERRKSK
jgi:hypothetical protein